MSHIQLFFLILGILFGGFGFVAIWLASKPNPTFVVLFYVVLAIAFLGLAIKFWMAGVL